MITARQHSEVGSTGRLPADVPHVTARTAGVRTTKAPFGDALGGLMAVVLAVAVATMTLGPVRTLLILGVPSTFAMPVLGAIADWGAGVRFRGRPWTTVMANTAIIVAFAALLTLGGQIVAGHLDLAGAIATSPRRIQTELTTFPYVIPIGAIAFVSFLQISIVCEGREYLPKRFGPKAGRYAVLGCLAVAVIAYLALANWDAVPKPVASRIGLAAPTGPVPALDLATWLITVSVFQTAYGLLDGWPFKLIRQPVRRIATANFAVVALGSASYAVARTWLGVSESELAGAGGAFVAGFSVVKPILNGWPLKHSRLAIRRAWLIASTLLLTAAAYAGLRWLGLRLDSGWTPQAPVYLWEVICGLNAVGGTALWYRGIFSNARHPQT